ncbi:MAG: hypothetical protein QY331_01225 [Melioribacteraceae bacterium]|jgi:outer membrane lipoprotein-sorting protein|nr:MAG: hypothetical protein C4543_08300 [Ignavibacteriales bacterium]WKZ69872.1 MAG: hypothetical protein QY331_01225 [Melioribacteraceae bacterium]
MFLKKRNIISMIMILCLSTIFAQGQMQQDQSSEAQLLFQEYNQLNQQIQQLQQQAMNDENIAQKGEALDKEITDAMVKNNPEIKKSLDKRDNIISQYQAAEQSGDQQKMQSLGQEFQSVSQIIQTEQQKVIQQPEIGSHLQEFETLVMQKMEAINPETPQLLSKLEQLRNKLMTMQQQQPNQN